MILNQQENVKMSTQKLTSQDKKDLDKFMKFLALKAAQIIVQSRSGDKVITKCKPDSSGTDWFNLAIHDLPEVLTEAKKVLCGDIINSPIPLCVEISLRTVEGDTMVLETWSLGVLHDQTDPTVRVTYTVYNRMGTLLKSLVSISRMIPAYKLSRRQSQDAYVICYRIYMGDPQLHSLGENYKHIRIGQLCTPVGTIHLSVCYRTKMTISPTQTSHDTIMLKSDHFHSDFSPRLTRHNNSEEVSKSLSDTIKVGAFVVNKQKVVTEEDLVIPDVPFSSLLTPKQPLIPLEIPYEVQYTPLPQYNSTVMSPTIGVSMNSVGISSDSNNGNIKSTVDIAALRYNSRNDSRRSSCSITSANDDFIMVDLKTPFAGTNSNSDLGAFYRECQSAPQLQAFMEEKTLAEQVGDLTKQLETFELNIQKYGDMLSTLCHTENNN